MKKTFLLNCFKVSVLKSHIGFIKIYFLTMLMVVIQFAAIAQQKNVSGSVTDETGNPLPGVTVLLKGTNTGTVTDNNGNYKIEGLPVDAVLVFSFVGMVTQEINVDNQKSINIKLKTDAIGLV
jgi:hypothetical protein